ncbi:QsdR family transcriptional regulator [Conexibacter sp. SYSU D00693]|uniref:QsdR family transcriptional regulator n=1 Tax=Conexibacter sp. SYSU D00693 TaxID=2812560 RepID=UPI00196B7A7B|nr:QsdR family transcriptional regulator [Conexibacter sp. SYSU D00693]
MKRTALERQLDADAAPPRPTALDAFKLARRQFMAGERVEMTALAQTLGVSRVTLNRWVGSRDVLLGEVLWSLGRPTLDGARSRTTATGGEGVATTLQAFLEDVQAYAPMRAFLAREREIALRILTTHHSRFQGHLVTWTRDLLLDELPGRPLPLEVDDLAYLIVRINESFFYVDMIAGGQPDPAKAGQAIRALLR